MLVTMSIFIIFMLLYLFFWFFSILGWLVEVVYCSLYDKRLVNRGFLIGPYCPLYGCGALIMLVIAQISDNSLIIFILAMTLCTLLEYITSFLMESLFQVRWWDYSNYPFNINGRVCLRNSIAFGALGVISVKILFPWYKSLISFLDYDLLFTITIDIFVITITDILFSFHAMSNVKNVIEKNIDKYKNRDVTEEVKHIIKGKIPGVNFLHKRLINTYHLLDKKKDYLMKKIVEVNKNRGYILFIIFIVIGLIIGFVLSFYFNVASYKILIPLSLSISSLIASIILKVGDK